MSTARFRVFMHRQCAVVTAAATAAAAASAAAAEVVEASSDAGARWPLLR